MRIGIMLRAYDRPGGIGIYSRNIVEHLLRLDSTHHYVLFYNNAAHIGRYADRAHVTEVHVPSTHPLLWDQWHIARAVRLHDIQLLFNTKFSLPLACRARRIMVLHGSSWFVHPELYRKTDIAYVRLAMPVYCRAADFLISNSDLTTGDFTRILGIPTDKIETVRLAAGDHFKPISDAARLREVGKKYALPDRFVLTVTSYDPRKNFEALLDAFEVCYLETGIHLVVVGKNGHLYSRDFRLESRGLGTVVHFPGWIEQDDLPALYSLATAFIFPSIYEEFGIPVVEAMACGCPIASSSTGAIPELTAGAALLCHPSDTAALTDNLLELLTSKETHARCRALGLERAREFSWEKNARRTLEIFHQVAEKP